MSWWRLVNLEYIYQSRTIDGCFKTPARLAISFLTQLKVAYQRNRRFGAIVAIVGHQLSSYCWLVILSPTYHNVMDQDMHVFPFQVCFNLGDTLLLFIVSMCYPADLDLSHDLFLLISGGNAEDEESKPPIRILHDLPDGFQLSLRDVAAFDRFHMLLAMCHGRLKRLQANQAMKLGKWTKILGGWGWENLNIPSIYVYVYSKAIYTYIVIYRYMHILRCIKSVGLEGMPGAPLQQFGDGHPSLQWFFTLTRKITKNNSGTCSRVEQNRIEQWKNAGWFGYIGDYTTQLFRDYNKPL